MMPRTGTSEFRFRFVYIGLRRSRFWFIRRQIQAACLVPKVPELVKCGLRRFFMLQHLIFG